MEAAMQIDPAHRSPPERTRQASRPVSLDERISGRLDAGADRVPDKARGLCVIQTRRRKHPEGDASALTVCCPGVVPARAYQSHGLPNGADSGLIAHAASAAHGVSVGQQAPAVPADSRSDSGQLTGGADRSLHSGGHSDAPGNAGVQACASPIEESSMATAGGTAGATAGAAACPVAVASASLNGLPDRRHAAGSKTPDRSVSTTISHVDARSASGDGICFDYAFRSWPGAPVASVTMTRAGPGMRTNVAARDSRVFDALVERRSGLDGDVCVDDRTRQNDARRVPDCASEGHE